MTLISKGKPYHTDTLPLSQQIHIHRCGSQTISAEMDVENGKTSMAKGKLALDDPQWFEHITFKYGISRATEYFTAFSAKRRNAYITQAIVYVSASVNLERHIGSNFVGVQVSHPGNVRALRS